MRKLILILFILLSCGSLANSGMVSFPGGGVPSAGGCSEGSGATIIGIAVENDSDTNKNANDLMLGRYPALFSCEIDTVSYYLENFIATEYAVVGVYSDNGQTLYSDSDIVEGGAGAGEYVFTLDSAVSLTKDTYYIIAISISSGVTLNYESGQASGIKNKTITGVNYTGSAPATVDSTSMADTTSYRLNGESP